ncbi:MAG: lysophospholipid acyltransferase family protein [Sulfurimonadaceae bacterium]
MRKRLLRSLALFLIPPIGSLLIRLFYFSSKKVFHLPATVPEEPFIAAFWHGDLVYQPFLYYQLRNRPNINVVISDHFDGQIIAKTIHHLKLNTIHGSSTRNAAKVLIAAIKTLKNGGDIGITPDGPKGPRHEVADGVVIMAQKTKAKVIIFSCVPKSYWQFNSWDRFTIPKPFTRLDFYASEPLDLSGMEKEEARALIKEKLLLHDY